MKYLLKFLSVALCLIMALFCLSACKSEQTAESATVWMYGVIDVEMFQQYRYYQMGYKPGESIRVIKFQESALNSSEPRRKRRSWEGQALT